VPRQRCTSAPPEMHQCPTGDAPVPHWRCTSAPPEMHRHRGHRKNGKKFVKNKDNLFLLSILYRIGCTVI